MGRPHPNHPFTDPHLMVCETALQSKNRRMKNHCLQDQGVDCSSHCKRAFVWDIEGSQRVSKAHSRSPPEVSNSHIHVIILFTAFSPSQWMSLRRHHESLASILGLGIHGVYVNSSIVNEGALVKNVPYKVEGWSNPIQHHQTNSKSQTLFPELVCPRIAIYRLQSTSLHFHLHNGWVYVDITNP